MIRAVAANILVGPFDLGSEQLGSADPHLIFTKLLQARIHSALHIQPSKALGVDDLDVPPATRSERSSPRLEIQ